MSGAAVLTDRSARPSLLRLGLVEVRKMLDTRAGFWLLLLTALAAVGGMLGERLSVGEDVAFGRMYLTAIATASLLPPVIAVLLVTSEWSQRTGLSTFALVPARERVVVAKVIGATVLTVFAVAACFAVAAAGNVFTGGDWSLGLGDLGRLALYELIGMLGGVAFGLVFMNSALAIVMYFVIPIGWSILGETIAALDKPADWLDLGRPMATLADTTASMSGTDWAQLATAGGVWVVLVFALGLIRLRRTELK